MFLLLRLAYICDMHTSPSRKSLSGFPIACTLCLVEEGVIGTGWIWELSSARGFVQSALLAGPGMVVKTVGVDTWSGLDAPGRTCDLGA